MFEKIVEQVVEKITPVLVEARKQAAVSLLANVATQIYCSENMRSGNPNLMSCIKIANDLIRNSKIISEDK
jgi:hypothetical protein